MFYVASYTPSGIITEANAVEKTIKASAGVIHQVDVLFQSGCKHNCYVRIFKDIHQLWPTNRDEYLRGDATVVSFREFVEIHPGDNILTVKFWTGTSGDYGEVIVQVGILPKRIIQPLSFEELLAAAAGIR